MEFASKHFCKSAGVVASSEGGPSSPDEQTHMSNRPHELRTSSIRTSVSSSLATLKGYPMIFVLGEVFTTWASSASYPESLALSHAVLNQIPRILIATCGCQWHIVKGYVP
jgi:hypothetical protein